MVFSVATALERLQRRHLNLYAERTRIATQAEQELARVDAQLAATEGVLASLKESKTAGDVDALLIALDKAGLRLSVADA